MTAETSSVSPGLDPGVLHTCSVGPKAEDAVLKAGLLAVGEALGRDGLLDFPRRGNGTPILMRQGFFERLLKGEASLQDCASADCTAAEGDVKRLALKQLLTIRCNHLDYMPEAKSQPSKATFLQLVDRCTSIALAERLLAGQELPDAHKVIIIRHAMLIYGASKERWQATTEGTVSEEGVGLSESEWWLLAVGGTRRYLHLPSCEVSADPPSGPVYCYRSYTAPDPRDPKRKRVFRWQALLVKDPSKWTEDPLATEQKAQKKTRLTDAKDASGAPAQPKKGAAKELPVSLSVEASGFSLFDDFDVEDLFDDFDADTPEGSTDKTPLKATEVPADMDDFFDSLLSDSLFDEGGAGATSPSSKAVTIEPATASSALPSGGDSPTEESRSCVEAVAKSPDAGADNAVPAAENGTAVASTFEPPARTAEAEPEEQDEGPPRDVAEAQLRMVLERFYRERKINSKLSNVAKIARKYSGEKVVELWSMLATKYSLPPPEAVRWLASVLGPFVAIQYSQGGEPAAARAALDNLLPAPVEGGAEVPAEGWGAEAFPETAVKEALEANDVDVISALGFRGCPSSALRPQLWRAFLGCGYRDEAQGLRDHREAYIELKTRALDVSTEASTGEDGEAKAVTRAEVEADARTVWRGEDFVERPEVIDAICNIVLTYARKNSYISGSCEVAALMIFVMARSGTASSSELQDAEADAYWCFSTLMAEAEDCISNDAGDSQARRIFGILRVYDPPLAELLKVSGLLALPAMRLGSALCTRAGFSLQDCARLWDSMLADPRRFEFCDFTVVAMLLLTRGDLLQRDDVGSLAETMIAAPRGVEMADLLRSTYALCAFERRCPAGSRGAFPPRPLNAASSDSLDGGAFATKGIDLDHVVSAARTKATEAASSVSSLWGKAWEAGRSAAGKAGEMITDERLQKVKDLGSSTAQAVASTASAAGSSARSAAAAAAAAANAQLESLDATFENAQSAADDARTEAATTKNEAVEAEDVWQEEAEEAAAAAVAAGDAEKIGDLSEAQNVALAQPSVPSQVSAAAPAASSVAASSVAPIVTPATAPVAAGAAEEEIPQLTEAPMLVAAPKLVAAPQSAQASALEPDDEFDVP